MCSAIGFPGLKALDPNSPHDDVCIVCKEEGNLLCCDFCPVTHHLTCLEPPMTTLPSVGYRLFSLFFTLAIFRKELVNLFSFHFI